MKEKDFNPLFNEWAPSYDQTVTDKNGEYNEVFEGYTEILMAVVRQIPEEARYVLEFGVGTGNLSEKLVQQGYQVIGVEPSSEMRRIVQEKQIQLELREGHFLDIPLDQNEKIDAIVSTYAFHHLTLKEKRKAIKSMKALLNPKGRIIFADTSFENEEQKRILLERVKKQGKRKLYEDLSTEFYEYIHDLKDIYAAEQFDVQFDPQNRFVWLSVATLR